MNQNPDDAPVPDPSESPAPREPGSRDFQKAEILRRVIDEDPTRERDLERSEVREESRSAAEPPPEREEVFVDPVVEAPPPPVRPFQPHGKGGGHRPHHGRGQGGGQQRQRVDLEPRRGRGRRGGPPPQEPEPNREQDRLRGALSAADARIRNLQREVDTLRNRLRSLAPTQVGGGTGTAGAVAPPPVAPSPPAPAPILRESVPGSLRDQRIGVLLDFPGLLALARKRGRSVSPGAILQGIVRGRALVRAIAYGAPPVGGELGSALRAAGFEALPAEGADVRAANDLRSLSRRLDAIVLVGFDDALAGPMREAGEAGARTEVAGFESHDSPDLAAAAHAFVRLGGEEPAGR
ncbi:MAG: NYN domain-containing protein [Planctomycetes bacterium]|nr:NYN domain-containing protein [Planctomycetota bacterium]